jgi:hypothetical protein
VIRFGLADGGAAATDLTPLTISNCLMHLSDLHEIVAAIVRAALGDEALATGAASQKCRTGSPAYRIVPPSAGRSPKT